MASTITLVNNVLTGQYLTHNGSSVAVHFQKYHQNNIHLYDDGPLRRLQVFSDSNKKLTHVPAGGCTQTLTTNTTGSIIHVISSAAGSAVQLCVQDTSGNKFYLRVNTAQNNNVQLVCQSYVDSVQYHPIFKKELEFNLITVDSNDLN